MARRRIAQAELMPVYVRPQFDRRERAALRDWRSAMYRGDRHLPKPGNFDPLWLRMGMRMHEIESRAGWVDSNPLLDEDLRRKPANDPSLPGRGWLREVYVFWRGQQFTTLPGVRALLLARRQAVLTEQMRASAMPSPRSRAPVPQGELFAEVS